MKLVSTSVFLASLFSNQGMAQSERPQGQFTVDSVHKDIVSLGDQTKTCLDINGTWRGFCDDSQIGENSRSGAVRKETQMSFSQKGCALIQAEQFGASHLGAVKSESVSSPRGVLNQTASSYWLSNGKKLGMNQSYSLVMFGDKGSISIGEVQGDFQMNGSALTGKITQHVNRMNMAGKKIGDVTTVSDCSLERL
ncbi:MAG: hypothetical protein NT027_01410 [Proteobacteria bacterium]|nr:hypothetical protein [Pseudomonadota bacterium]